MKERFNKKIIILILFFITLITVLFIFNNIHFNLETNSYKYEINSNSISNLNKIIIVGDSRMSQIDNSKDKMNIPNNIIFDAKSGAKIDWLYDIGIPELYKIIKNMNKNYKYKVIFNLGVNDLNSDREAIKLAEDYFNAYKKIIVSNKNISFYFLSVNPIDEIALYEKFDKNSKRTNKRIEEFNSYFIDRLSKENIENAKYCDSYNTLNFVLPDGLHYDSETDKKIIDYIIERCANDK